MRSELLVQMLLWGSASVLFSSGSITKCHRLGPLNNRNLFLTVLETGSAHVWWELSFWVLDSHLLAVSSHGFSLVLQAGEDRGSNLPSIFSYKGVNPIMRNLDLI